MEAITAILREIIDFLQTYNGAVTAVATAVIAVFTVVLALVTNRQAKLTKRTADIAERALHDLERAVITPAFKPVEREAEEWHVHILLSNVGRSFGIVKGLFARFAQSGAFLPSMPPDDGYEARPTDTVLTVHTENWDGLAAFKMPSKQEGQIIYGYILYEDVFGRMWRNRFACEVWSEQRPGRHYYVTVGGTAYNTETRET